MSKAIKVEIKVYEELDAIRRKGETFSMVVAALLNTRKYILNLMGALEGSIKYDQWKREQLEKAKAINEAKLQKQP